MLLDRARFAYDPAMIRLRVGAGDFGRLRFAFSPLAEVAESVHMLSAHRIRPPHVPWFRTVRESLRDVDMRLLCSIIPARHRLVGYLYEGALDRSVTVAEQVDRLAAMPAERLADTVRSVWDGAEVPSPARALVAEGQSGPRHLADVIAEYWHVALEPFWPRMRSVLDDDVAYRAQSMIIEGGETLLADLHPEVTVTPHALEIAKPCTFERDLDSAGLTLVPSVFAWPRCLVSINTTGPVNVVYGARGVATVWDDPQTQRNALADVMGRTRAAILESLVRPRSTTDLAIRLGHTPPSISQHLTILKHNGLVMSWRSGRRVLYERTALGTRFVTLGDARTARWTGREGTAARLGDVPAEPNGDGDLDVRPS